jgi:hypothetical protein
LSEQSAHPDPAAVSAVDLGLQSATQVLCHELADHVGIVDRSPGGDIARRGLPAARSISGQILPIDGGSRSACRRRRCHRSRRSHRSPLEPGMDTKNLLAIDTHTHLEVSCRNPFDKYGEEYDRAADRYFRSSSRPTMQETIDYYRERKIGFVNFTVDAETQLGRRRIPNEEIAEAAMANPDIMIAFGSIDPHKGRMGAREARKLVEEYGVKGFKFHPTVQGFEPADRMA